MNRLLVEQCSSITSTLAWVMFISSDGGGSAYFDIRDLIYGWGGQGIRFSQEIKDAYNTQVATTTMDEDIQTCKAAEDVLMK